jgi:hypothetical protein
LKNLLESIFDPDASKRPNISMCREEKGRAGGMGKEEWENEEAWRGRNKRDEERGRWEREICRKTLLIYF